MKKYCLLLDLKDDAALITEYEAYHQNVWEEIVASLVNSGITSLEIYRLGNRLVMIMETVEDFSFEKKAEMDKVNTKVQEWEELMWKYQQALPMANEGEKWLLTEKIYDFQVEK
jgi:L-rhamnose mutarotase